MKTFRVRCGRADRYFARHWNLTMGTRWPWVFGLGSGIGGGFNVELGPLWFHAWRTRHDANHVELAPYSRSKPEGA